MHVKGNKMTDPVRLRVTVSVQPFPLTGSIVLYPDSQNASVLKKKNQTHLQNTTVIRIDSEENKVSLTLAQKNSNLILKRYHNFLQSDSFTTEAMHILFI